MGQARGALLKAQAHLRDGPDQGICHRVQQLYQFGPALRFIICLSWIQTHVCNNTQSHSTLLHNSAKSKLKETFYVSCKTYKVFYWFWGVLVSVIISRCWGFLLGKLQMIFRYSLSEGEKSKLYWNEMHSPAGRLNTTPALLNSAFEMKWIYVLKESVTPQNKYDVPFSHLQCKLYSYQSFLTLPSVKHGRKVQWTWLKPIYWRVMKECQI